MIEAKSYAALMSKTWSDNILFSVLLELTYRCNWDCFFCYNDLNLRGTPLTTEQYFRFFEDLKQMQAMNLTFSGGEPLTHPDFFRLGAKARELGFVIRIKSNGHALTGELARRVREEIDPFQLEVSIHGACAETHDRLTRMPGSFDRLVSNLKELKQMGFRLRANCPLTAWNEKEVEGILGIGDRLGIQIQFDPVLTPRDDGDRTPLEIAPSREGILNLFLVQRRRYVEERTGSESRRQVPEIGRDAETGMAPAGPRKHCGAGSSGVTVDPYGTVYPCVQWRRSIGSLHHQSIQEIWEGKNATLEEIRRLEFDIKTKIDSLGEMSFAMGFCPGLAEELSGDPSEVYPAALAKMEVYEEAERLVPLTVDG